MSSRATSQYDSESFTKRRAKVCRRFCWKSTWNINKLNKVNLEFFEHNHRNCPDEQCIVVGETAATYGVIDKVSKPTNPNLNLNLHKPKNIPTNTSTADVTSTSTTNITQDPNKSTDNIDSDSITSQATLAPNNKSKSTQPITINQQSTPVGKDNENKNSENSENNQQDQDGRSTPGETDNEDKNSENEKSVHSNHSNQSEPKEPNPEENENKSDTDKSNIDNKSQSVRPSEELQEIHKSNESLEQAGLEQRIENLKSAAVPPTQQNLNPNNLDNKHLQRPAQAFKNMNERPQSSTVNRPNLQSSSITTVTQDGETTQNLDPNTAVEGYLSRSGAGQPTLNQVLQVQHQQNLNTQDFMNTMAEAMAKLTTFVTAGNGCSGRRSTSRGGNDERDSFDGDDRDKDKKEEDAAFNSTFFLAKHIEPDDDTDIFNFTKKKARIYQKSDRDLSLTKKLKAVQAADIEKWDKSKYKSCLSYLWKEYNTQISKVATLTPYEICCFIYMGFDLKNKNKIMKAISEVGRQFVEVENFIDKLVRLNMEIVRDDGWDPRNDRLDLDKLRLIVYPAIAQVVQPGVMTIDQDIWEHDAGHDLVDYFRETLDLIQIDNDSVLKDPNPKELAAGLKKLVSLLEKNGQKEVVNAIGLNSTLQRVTRRMINDIKLPRVIEELEGCFLIAEPSLIKKSKSESTNHIAAVEESVNWVGNSNSYQTNRNGSGWNSFQTNRNSQQNRNNFGNKFTNTSGFNNYNRNRAPYDRFYRDNSRNQNQRQNNFRTNFQAYRPMFQNQYVNALMDAGKVEEEPDQETYDCLVEDLDIDFEDPVEEGNACASINMTSLDNAATGFLHVRLFLNSSSSKESNYIRALLDNASSCNMISPSVLKEHGLDRFKYKAQTPTQAKTINATTLLPDRVKLFCRLGAHTKSIDFVVGPESMSIKAILGTKVCDMLGITKAILEQLYKMRIPVDKSLGSDKGSIRVMHIGCQTEDIPMINNLSLSPINDPERNSEQKVNAITNFGRCNPEGIVEKVDTNKNAVTADTKKVQFCNENNKIYEIKNDNPENENSESTDSTFENNSENSESDDNTPSSVDSEVDTIEDNDFGGSKSMFITKNDSNNDSNTHINHVLNPNTTNNITFTSSPVKSSFPENNPVTSEAVSSNPPVKETNIPSDPTSSVSKKRRGSRRSQAEVEADMFKGLLGKLNINQKRLLCSLIDLDSKGAWDASVNLTEAGKILQNHADPVSFEVESDLKCYISVDQDVIVPAGNHMEVKVKFPEGSKDRSWSCHPFKRSNLHVMDRIVYASSTADTALHVSNHNYQDIKLHAGQRIAVGKLLNCVDLPTHGLESDVQKRKTLYSQKELANVFATYEAVVNRELVNTNRKTEYVNVISDGIIGIKEATAADKEKLDKIHDEYKKSREEEFHKLVDKLEPELKSVFIEFKDRFMGDAADEWKLLNVKPISLPLQPNHPRQVRVNYKKRFTDKEQKVIDDFLVTSLSRKLITRSNSNILSPLLIVPKPNNRGFRVCCDFRQVNQRVFDYNSHIIPEISDILLKLGSKTLFTMFDVSSAYWRCPLADDGSREATAFVVHQGEFAGVYQWSVLPFGPKAAVSLFSRIMDDCLRGLKECGSFWYLDDVVVSSGDKNMTKEQKVTQHAQDIRKLLLRARATNLTFSIEKTVIAQENVEVLGFFLGGGKVRPGKQTINKINGMISAVDLDASMVNFQTVLGFFNYSRKFVPMFSKGHKEIRKLKEDYDAHVKEKSKSADELKILKDLGQDKITKILKTWAGHITSTSLTVPSVDDVLEISADAADERMGYLCRIAKSGEIIEFNSREFSPTEKRYSIMEKELLALAEGLEKLRIYVHRAPKVICLSDNSCAVSAINSSKTNLSARALRFVMRIQSSPNCSFSHISTHANTACDALSRGLVFATCTEPATAVPVEVNSSDKVDECAQTEGDYLDEEMKLKIREIHEQQGHICSQRLVDILKFHFPNLKASREQVKSVLDSCSHCVKVRRLGSASSIGRLPVPPTPNHTLHIDHFSPRGRDALCRKSAVLSVRDSFSKFTSLFACTGYSHSEILNHIRTWCTIFGVPKTIFLDNALVSTAMRNFSKYLGFDFIETPAYSPQANGIVERVHRDVRKLLPHAIDRLELRDSNWTNALPKVCSWINSNTHSVTKKSPNEIQLGWNNLDIDLKSADRWSDIRKKLQVAQDKCQHDNAGPFKDTTLEPGVEVWAYLAKVDPVPAVVIKDYGKTVEVEKVDRFLTRFQTIKLDKSNLSLRI